MEDTSKVYDMTAYLHPWRRWKMGMKQDKVSNADLRNVTSFGTHPETLRLQDLPAMGVVTR